MTDFFIGLGLVVWRGILCPLWALQELGKMYRVKDYKPSNDVSFDVAMWCLAVFVIAVIVGSILKSEGS